MKPRVKLIAGFLVFLLLVAVLMPAVFSCGPDKDEEAYMMELLASINDHGRRTGLSSLPINSIMR